jgi:adenylate kinase
MKHILIFGPPGSGKGTMTEMITKNHNYMSLVAGDLLREERNSGSELGKVISSLIDEGNFVPDEMITGIISDEIKNLPKEVKDKKKGLIFDGYPRSIQQAESLDSFDDIDVDMAVYLKCDEDILIDRILERGKTSGREDDQDKDIIMGRMENYWKVTDPVRNFYKEKGSYVEIDASKDIQEVYDIFIATQHEKSIR